MSDDLEQQLRAARRAPPSPQLDRRMDALFAGPQARARDRWWRVVVPAAGVAAAFALIRLLPEREAVSVPPPAPERIVYQVEARGLMREMLVPSTRPPAPPALEATVRL